MKHKYPGQLISEAVAKNTHCRYSLTELMEKYAKQQSLAFHKWMEAECYEESSSYPGYYMNSMSIKWTTLLNLYKQFLKSQK